MVSKELMSALVADELRCGGIIDELDRDWGGHEDNRSGFRSGATHQGFC